MRARTWGGATVAALALSACTASTPADTRTRDRDRRPGGRRAQSRRRRAARSPSRSPGTSTSRRTSARCCGGASVRSHATLRAADVAMVNLETPVTQRGRQDPKELEFASDRYYFRTPPRALGALAEAGVDVVTVANNHAGDYGQVGLADTIRAARRSRVAVVGAGRDAAEAFTPHVVRVDDLDVAFLARRHRAARGRRAASGRPVRTTPGSRRRAAAGRTGCSTPSSPRPPRRTWSWSTCTGAARTRRVRPRASACSAASSPTPVPTSSSAATRTSSAVPAGPATPTCPTGSATSSGTTPGSPTPAS